MSSSFLYNALDSYFCMTQRGTTLLTEFRAGSASFFTLSYLLLVNPQIMSQAGVSYDDAVVATALSAAISCFIVGIFGNLPFGTAPGIGLSAYLSYSLVQAKLATLSEALTACFTSGLVLVLVALTGFTAFLMKVVPECVKYGIVVGMGLLIAMIGMVSVELIVPNTDTIVGLGNVASDSKLWLTILGMILVASLLYHNVKGGILIGIAVVAVLQWGTTNTWPTDILDIPMFHHHQYIHLDVMIDPTKAPVLWTAVGAFLLICVFDISGVIFGLATLGGLIEVPSGQIPGSIWVFLASAVGTLTAAYFGSTPIICCVETASGIKEGGRTGITAIVIGLYFVLSLFLSPLFAAVPNDATAPVLILVGVMMMGESSKVEWHDMSQALPAFLTLVLMPLTYSITNGMIFGLAASMAFYFTKGQFLVDLKDCWNKLSTTGSCCGGSLSGGISPLPNYEEIPSPEWNSLLLETGGGGNGEDSTIEQTIENPMKLLNGSVRNVEFGAVLY
jgi:AGZA family xanthine/uracil permease-like MFS transporter